MKQFDQGKLLCVLGFLLILVLTYFRENLALEINAYLNKETYNRAYTYWFSDYFSQLSLSKLKYWKWGVLLLFSITISAVTVFSLHAWFKTINLTRLALMIYGIAFGLLILLVLVGFLTHTFDFVYLFVRRVLGIILSPIPFFYFFLLFYFSKKNKTI